MTLKQNFKIGNLTLVNNIIYAPLAEYTDFPFRKLIRYFHKGLIFCEMIKMEALIRGKNKKILKYNEAMHPIGAQICGSNPLIAKDASKIIEDLGFDLIDLNCGCPVSKIIRDGSGSALLKTPKLLYKILESIKLSVTIPVTVKIRVGWDKNSIYTKEIVQIAKDVGCSAITIHGRTKRQGYTGKSNWDFIKECKDIGHDILIIGNGDLYTFEDVDMMFKKTNCDGIMIARGMLQNPNLVNEIENYFFKTNLKNYDIKEVVLKYINFCIEEKGIEKTIFDIKKICGWLFRNKRNIKKLRIRINSTNSTIEAINLINNFDWNSTT